MVMKYFKLTGYRLPLFIITFIVLVFVYSPLTYLSKFEEETKVLDTKIVTVTFNSEGKTYTKDIRAELKQFPDKSDTFIDIKGIN